MSLTPGRGPDPQSTIPPPPYSVLADGPIVKVDATIKPTTPSGYLAEEATIAKDVANRFVSNALVPTANVRTMIITYDIENPAGGSTPLIMVHFSTGRFWSSPISSMSPYAVLGLADKAYLMDPSMAVGLAQWCFGNVGLDHAFCKMALGD